MERFVDRIILFLMMVFAGQSILTDRYLIVVIYISLAVAFLNYFLLFNTKNKKTYLPEGISEITAFVLQMISLVMALLYHDFAIMIPIFLYDMIILKNYVGIILSSVLVLVFANNTDNTLIGLYLILMMVISAYLSMKSEKSELLKKNVKELRDESIIREEELSKKNNSLLKAKDDEIYFSTIKERNRIAREIHDNVGHMLTRAILQLGALITVCKEKNLKDGLEGLKETLDTAMNNIRSSVHDLRDEAIDLPSAIEEIVKPLKNSKKLNLEIDVSSEIDKDIKYAVIGVVKEGVSNIIKHSENECVNITLNEHPSMYQLVIHDYSEKEMKSNGEIGDIKGMGLDNIRTRVESVKGNVLITNENGFRIFVTIKK
ncbi:MAG: hypothetical protein K6F97_11465 [Lachnospiraceae bacterium]|nr:hypothetical protein [Lachnospiraceae bacterium]